MSEKLSGLKLHAEIIGAGMGGLAAAAALAQKGWSVRVHERRPELCPTDGYALACFENLLKVLEAVGAYDEAVKGAGIIHTRQTINRHQKPIHTLHFSHRPGDRMIDISRANVLLSLAHAAERSGAEILLDSEVVNVSNNGRVTVADGKTYKSDLLVVANGVWSKLHEPLGLSFTRTPLKDGVIRAMVTDSKEGRMAYDKGLHREIWSGRRRLMLVPFSRENLFLACSMLDSDERAKSVPLDVDVWSKSFPNQAHLIKQADPEQQRWDLFHTMSMESWSTGRAVVIGDAAHAQAPNLGQGAACAMMSAYALAHFVSSSATIEQGLAAWEESERPIIEHTQRISSFYSRLVDWPDAPREAIFRLMNNWRWMNKQRQRTANYTPTGMMA